MESIVVGNLEQKKIQNPRRRGWFIGHFMEPGSVLKNDNFEVRWGIHKKGEKKRVPAANTTAKTISILIKGKFAIKFPEEKREVMLSEVGDFVFWDAKIYHTSEALTDSTVLTIRWPSLPSDQKAIN